MIRYKIKDVAFECDEAAGTAKVIAPGYEKTFTNAIEAWNTFKSYALEPLERDLRDKLEANGFNRWTGTRDHLTETEMKIFDDIAAIKERRYDV
ncbi:MAG: hypothetical protein K5898_03475 [Ruminococcus sp.]|uniref:hypothetical protein n=1 Tax=Ruminococcus sp. TaxID=41978 RepID=UPI0025F71CE4|nr:hypothetical protein [Ruminococcus sp.]MCR4794228.1 hypothetical protein [Ruminococcus sp.]